MSDSSPRHVDLVIRNGLLAAGTHASEVADLAISDGLVAGIGSGPWIGRREIDARGLIVMPGAIDPHTHLNNWPFGNERRAADNFESGSQAAVAGGITTICDFVYMEPNQSVLQQVEILERQIVSSSLVDVALHISITNARCSLFQEIPGLVSAGFPSFKFYTQLDDYSRNAIVYLELMGLIASCGGTAMFHCEDQAIIDYCAARLHRLGHVSPRYYAESKPVEVELSATAQALAYASISGVRAYVVHLSCAAALDQVIASRSRGCSVIAETRPIYLHLTDSEFDAPESEAALYVGTPPLRSKPDCERLWEGLADGSIDTVGSDHVGFKKEAKYVVGDTFESVPKGVSNLQTMVPMLYSEGVLSGKITLERFVSAVSETPARTFGLYPQKGALLPGSDADVCVLDPHLSRRVVSEEMLSRSDFEVFEGWNVTGWPVLTLLRGQIVYQADPPIASRAVGRLALGKPEPMPSVEAHS